MTRETKIGLLVGLAFIIVIGILLSDHLTSSTEPPPAAIAQAGQAVRSAVSTPAGQATQPPVTVIQPPQVQPQQTIQTANDLSPKPQPVTMVQIAPPSQNEPPVTIAQQQQQQQQPIQSSPVNDSTPVAMNDQQPKQTPESQPVTLSSRQDDPILTRLNNEAQKIGEMLVPVGGNSNSTKPQNQIVGAGTKYKAEPGDTLSKIAQKHYGSGNKQYRDAIIAANPALRDNPNLIIEGRSYVIPAVAKTDTALMTAPPAAGVNPRGSTPPSNTSTNENVYVVQEGDYLTRIAMIQTGSAGGVAAIKELNRDLLKGSDVIRPGMKLKMPAKPGE